MTALSGSTYPLNPDGVHKRISQRQHFQFHRPDKRPARFAKRLIQLFSGVPAQHIVMRLTVLSDRDVTRGFQAVFIKGQYLSQPVAFLRQLAGSHARQMLSAHPLAIYGECQYHPATATYLSLSRLSGVHGGERLQACAEPENVRAGAADDAERVRDELREAAHQAGHANQPDAQGGQQGRLAAEVRRNSSEITHSDRQSPVFLCLTAPQGEQSTVHPSPSVHHLTT